MKRKMEGESKTHSKVAKKKKSKKKKVKKGQL